MPSVSGVLASAEDPFAAAESRELQAESRLLSYSLFLSAAVSMPLNMTEERAKPTLKDQKKFFAIAFASAKECQAILQIADLQNHAAWRMLDSLTAHIYRLIESAR